MISVIICTKNNGASLKKTLQCLEDGRSTNTVEVLVVDNGSTDDTRAVVERFPTVHYLYEPVGGQAQARNTGLQSARGEIIAFTDDDVSPPVTWLDAVTPPLRSGQADIVAGGIRLADELKQPWMEAYHLGMLAQNIHENPETIQLAVGANMVFHRRVLEKVPSFDPELGPGALGFCDDLLFNWQLKEAGFRLLPLLTPEATVVHSPNTVRFNRAAFLTRARREGQALAYIHYHWTQDDIAQAGLFAVKRRLRLLQLRLQGKDKGEVPSQAVMNVLQDVAFYDTLQTLRGTERNYTRRGLVKRAT